jgi:hypothetical protein
MPKKSYTDILKELKTPPPKVDTPNPHLVKVTKDKIVKI